MNFREAVKTNNLKAVKALIETGNYRTGDVKPYIKFALQKGYSNVATTLLDHVRRVHKTSYSLLVCEISDYATGEWRTERALCFHLGTASFANIPDRLKKDKYGLGVILFGLVEKNDAKDLCEMCIQPFTNLSVHNTLGETVLHFAILQQNHKLLRDLLQYDNAKPHVKFKDATSAAELAINSHDIKALKLILKFDRKFPPEDIEQHYTTYFHQAFKEGDIEVSRMLLKTGHVDEDTIVDGEDTKKIIESNSRYFFFRRPTEGTASSSTNQERFLPSL